MNAPANKLVASILVADRPGIMRDVTSAIADLGGNIDGVSQTVVEGYFSVILTASFPAAATPQSVHRAIENNFRPNEAAIVVRPYALSAAEPRMAGGQPYILVIAGRDQPGILKRTTTLLAARGINIEDWSFQYEGEQVTYISLLTVPRSVPAGDLQAELRQSLDALGLRCTVQHENIFRATNEVGPIRALLKEAADAAQP